MYTSLMRRTSPSIIKGKTRVEFALNYSPQAVDLLRDGSITLDRLKCPDWPDLVAESLAAHPSYVHFGLIAGAGRMDKRDWTLVDKLLSDTDTPYVNMHLAPRLTDFPHLPAAELDSPAWREAAISQMFADVEYVVARYGKDRVIVENVPYYGQAPDTVGNVFVRACIEPDVIRGIVDETGVGFLLDISHARITARHIDMEERAYIEVLPTDRLRELHVTGMYVIDGVLTDHLDMTESDWRYFEWAMGEIARGVWARPRMVAFEYGGVSPKFDWRSRADVIAAQVPRLVRMVRGASELQGSSSK
jgi:uncharacterized protein (UPF0276 family)